MDTSIRMVFSVLDFYLQVVNQSISSVLSKQIPRGIWTFITAQEM